MNGRHPKLVIESRPQLPRHVRLKFDKLRDRWLLLAPERILVPDDTSVEVLQMCDGVSSVADLTTRLAAKYEAPEDEIARDVLAMLQDLADKGFLGDKAEVAT